ncbi:MAG: 30S ribosomal protein S20 [Flavobacteriaceae bacterium TMED116]|jgi:small subunit ribosomal protein S20|nr:MAG: 30S ribosomal protein S20 [Flavobacteriaceae bacterium TMED116]
MDRHKQQIKRDRQDLKRRAINSQNKSRMRTLIKSVLTADTKKVADEHYSSAVSFIDKMASKNIIHKNNAARQKSKISNHLNSLK